MNYKNTQIKFPTVKIPVLNIILSHKKTRGFALDLLHHYVEKEISEGFFK